MDWTVYILRCGDGSLYTGITTDFSRRLEEHRAGTGAKYTRGRCPLEAVYRENCPHKSGALRREAAIKRLSKEKKLSLCRAYLESGLEELPFSGENRTDQE